jgi:hypothetical protein
VVEEMMIVMSDANFVRIKEYIVSFKTKKYNKLNKYMIVLLPKQMYSTPGYSLFWQ